MPRPRTRSVTIRIPLRLLEQLDEECAVSQLNRTELIVRILRDHAERHAGDAGPKLQAAVEKLGVLERAMLVLIAREIERGGGGPLDVDEHAFHEAAVLLKAKQGD